MAQKQDAPYIIPGVIGRADGIVRVAGKPNYVYIRLAGSAATAVYNNRVNPVHGMPVLCGYDPLEPNRFQVLSIQSTIAEQIGFDSGDAGYAPASRYRWQYPGGGQDPLYVELRQWMPLRIAPAGGLTVYVYPGLVKLDSGWAVIGGTDLIDLSAHLPTVTGKALFVLLTINESGIVVVTAGVTVDLAALSQSHIPEAPVGTIYTLAAVRLYQGQTAIQEGRSNTDIADLRAPMHHRHNHADLPADGAVKIDGIPVDLTGMTTGQVIVYNAVSGTLLPGNAPINPDAIHDNQANEINAIAEKIVLVNDDVFLIEDSQAGFIKKKIKAVNLPAGGGSSGAITRIVEIVVGSGGANSVIFSSIPNGYRNLLISIHGRGTNASTEVDIRFTCNNDAGANYDYQMSVHHATTVAIFQMINTTFGYASGLAAANAPTGLASQSEISFANYRGTTFHKTAYVKSAHRVNTGLNNLRLINVANFWRSTSPITTLSFFLSAGNFAEGTIVTLYGLL